MQSSGTFPGLSDRTRKTIAVPVKVKAAPKMPARKDVRGPGDKKDPPRGKK